MTRIPELTCGYEPPEAVFEGESDEPLRTAVSDLLALGYTRLGVKWEGNSLRPERSRMLNLAGPRQQCFVGWHRDAQGQLLFHALTVFEDGGYIITWSGGPFAPQETERVRCNVLPGAGVGQVLARHANGLERMKRAGHRVVERWTPDDHLAAIRAFYAHPENPVRGALEGLRFRRAALATDGLIIAAGCAALILQLFPNRTAAALAGATAVCSALLQWAAALRARARSPLARVSLLEPAGVTGIVAILLWSLDLF